MIDLRSDTVTKPTQAMRQAMAEAEVGDDVYGEDPTVKRLEEQGATRMGKEAALFLPSGTMGNQVAILTHTKRGDEILVEANSHIFYYEVGGPAALSGVQTRTLQGEKGKIDPQLIRESIREENIHAPRTGLLCLEDTHNRAGGAVISPDDLGAMADAARERGVPVHLDGARIYNAATALEVDVRQLTEKVDSVMFCLSKGLGAPVGSLLAGSASFIDQARKNRKLLGGGMRQAGVLAAAGLVALETMVQRLAVDHQNARRLADGISQMLPMIQIDSSSVTTNILLFNINRLTTDADAFLRKLSEEGVLGSSFGPQTIRFVTHKDFMEEQIERVISALERTARHFVG